MAGLLNSQELMIADFVRPGDVRIPSQNQVTLEQHHDIHVDVVVSDGQGKG